MNTKPTLEAMSLRELAFEVRNRTSDLLYFLRNGKDKTVEEIRAREIFLGEAESELLKRIEQTTATLKDAVALTCPTN